MKVEKDGRVYNVSGVQLSAFLQAGYTQVEEKPKKTKKEEKPGADQ